MQPTRFEEYCARQRQRHGVRFVAPTDQRWIEAFNNGERYRVKVETTYGSGSKVTRWGYVSLTAGWNPCFILLARRGQRGSSDLLGDRDVIVDAKWFKE